MLRTLPLSEYASVVLDSTGSGTASIGPTASNEVWNVGTVAVRCDTNVNEAVANVYAGGGVSPRYFVGATYAGSTGDSTDSVTAPVSVGSEVFGVWSGGDAGTTAHLTVFGTRQVP